MRPQSFDPDARRYDPKDELVSCPHCSAWMLPLEEYEISEQSESPTVGAELWEFVLWGWWAFLYNYIAELVIYRERRAKLAREKQRLLPKYPNSLVCTRCLHITRRA